MVVLLGIAQQKQKAIRQKGDNKNNAAATPLYSPWVSSDEKQNSALNKNNIECFSSPSPRLQQL